MNRSIKTYDDLLIAKKALETRLQAQQELIKLDYLEIKLDVRKYLQTMSPVTNFFTRDKRSWLLGFGANKLVDVFVKKVLLARAGWITRLIVPFFIKNFSSHFIAEHQDEWVNNLVQWLTKSKNGTKEEKLSPETEQE